MRGLSCWVQGVGVSADFAGDVSLALDPHPAPDAPSTTDSLDVTTDAADSVLPAVAPGDQTSATETTSGTTGGTTHADRVTDGDRQPGKLYKLKYLQKAAFVSGLKSMTTA